MLVQRVSYNSNPERGDCIIREIVALQSDLRNGSSIPISLEGGFAVRSDIGKLGPRIVISGVDRQDVFFIRYNDLTLDVQHTLSLSEAPYGLCLQDSARGALFRLSNTPDGYLAIGSSGGWYREARSGLYEPDKMTLTLFGPQSSHTAVITYFFPLQSQLHLDAFQN